MCWLNKVDSTHYVSYVKYENNKRAVRMFDN